MNPVDPAPIWMDPSGGRSASRAPVAGASTAVLTFAVLGVALIGVGVFVLDWYQADILVSTGLSATASRKLDLQSDSFAVVAGAIGAIIALLGLKSRMSRGAVSAILLVTAGVTAASALYLMYGPPANDEHVDFPQLSATAKVSLAIGGPVTLAGAAAVAVAGVLVLAGTGPGDRR